MKERLRWRVGSSLVRKASLVMQKASLHFSPGPVALHAGRGVTRCSKVGCYSVVFCKSCSGIGIAHSSRLHLLEHESRSFRSQNPCRKSCVCNTSAGEAGQPVGLAD